ncbi:Oidioi.mRNA.OKI2018_I69.chr2.g4628.t1.cds [Oikopleura dioica]|uniref:Oidioi.mRNA.OKI2018_I69.chr2.g4628.t1.cds n=1 Tax=Oikopleura dioica TaxID=34765 RepID=A0ABN7T1R3_OIKDI|nr:Oidioi.mRNA.OKI2018_I69.chr2.g4628.t1.cds [Oikopleura dioica]
MNFFFKEWLLRNPEKFEKYARMFGAKRAAPLYMSQAQLCAHSKTVNQLQKRVSNSSLMESVNEQTEWPVYEPKKSRRTQLIETGVITGIVCLTLVYFIVWHFRDNRKIKKSSKECPKAKETFMPHTYDTITASRTIACELSEYSAKNSPKMPRTKSVPEYVL